MMLLYQISHQKEIQILLICNENIKDIWYTKRCMNAALARTEKRGRKRNEQKKKKVDA